MRTKTPKGRLLFAHVTTNPENDRDDYATDRRNVAGKRWSIRTYHRTVRADGASVPVTLMIVRERIKP